MTRRVIHDLTCLCGRHFRRTLYSAIDVTQHPGLRYAVLAGVLNTVQCPGCERIARVPFPFLYADRAHNRLFCVYPEGEQDDTALIENGRVRLLNPSDPTETAISSAGSGLPEMFGLDRLADLIAGDLSADEQMGSLAFDVRPGIDSERNARMLAGRIAVQIGGYVHSWREGGRLHLQVLGPSSALETLTSIAE